MKLIFKMIPVGSLFLALGANASFIKQESQINSLSHKIELEMQEAKKCLPQILKDKVRFCTGVESNLSTVKNIAEGGLGTCSKLIKDRGYRLIKEDEHQNVPEVIWNSFYQSTKWAETIHSEKYVFLKKIATEVDCLHEYIHVLQWTSNNRNALAPLNRKIKSDKLSALLMEASDQVALLKNPKDLKDQVSFIQSKISLSGEYAKVSAWLDEKDAYFLLYNVCDKQIKCSSEDWDTIIGNLFLLRDKLPWKFRNEIVHKAVRLLRTKEEVAILKADYIPMDQKDFLEIKSLFNQSIQDLIKHLKSKGIHLYQYVTNKNAFESSLPNKIPKDILTGLEMPNSDILTTLLSYSKIGQGFVLGKFLCTNDSKNHFILLTENSSKEVIIHEYAHYLQSLKNPEFCSALTSQNSIANDFKSGKILRKDYEAKILAAKVLIWKTEQEVYGFMNSAGSSSEQEGINNKIQNLIFSARLTTSDSLRVLPEINLKKIQFSIKNDLPVINILGGDFVVDFGAQDSVISPKLAFNHFQYDAFIPVQIKSLFNSLGEGIEAPEVIINAPMEIGGDKMAATKWMLANLKIPQIDGVVGFNFFKDKEMILYPKTRMIEFTSFKKRARGALPLQRDYDNKVRALEFICPKSELIARLDSGSQVEGDLKSTTSAPIKKSLMGQTGYSCGKLKIKGKFETDRQNDILFSHGASLNLGWPWIERFNKISISLKDAWISFE